MAQVVHHIRYLPDKVLEQSPWPVLAVCCSAMFLDLTNLSAVTIALPAVQTSFGTGSSELQWALAGYALTFGGFLLLGGRSGDLFGHRRVLIFGSTVFALFTICCGVAQSFIPLVVFRALQGIGAAFTIPSAQAHIAIIFTDPKKKAKALGFWGAAGSVGFVAGLILGGVLTSVLSWRWIFYISFIISVIVIIAEILILPHRTHATAIKEETIGAIELTEPQTRLKKVRTKFLRGFTRFDVIGIFLGIPGLLLLSYALSSGEGKGWGSTQTVAILLISVFMLILFTLHERTAPSPLLVPKLFKAASFNLTLVLAVFTYAIRQAATYFLTIQLQQYGNSPIHTSILFLPIGVSATAVGLTAGKVVPLLGAKLSFIIGWALSIPGVVLFVFITPSSSYWAFAFPGMILYVAGLGLVYITANFVIVSSAEKADQGAAAGIFNVALQVGGSVLGLTVMTAIAQAINSSFGHVHGSNVPYTQVAYRSIYYSCIILGGVGLCISLFAIKVPPNLAGTYRQNKQAPPTPEKNKQSSDGGTEERELESVPEEGVQEDWPMRDGLLAKPQPAARSRSTRTWRSQSRRSIHSWDIHTVSWLNIDDEDEDSGRYTGEK